MNKSIAIGLGTARRPKMLSQTLDSLVGLQLPDGYEVYLILADNAPDESVEDVAEEFQTRLSFPIHYIQEPVPGIVSMRNAIVEKALTLEANYLAFIDDDEVVSPEWLVEMAKTMEHYQADVVSGRTLRRLPADTPEWIRNGGFFEKGKRPTGIPRPTSSTCNVMFDVQKLSKEWKMRFDPRLNFVGSSDILFFNQAHEKGAKIIWSNEAVVEEIIPESRASQEWLLQRAYRIGNTMSVRYRIQNPLLVAYLKGIGFAIGEFFQALMYQLKFKSRSNKDAHFTQKMHHFNIGRGIFNGLFGKVFEEYRQHHGH